ncbi:hypothetical protein LSTR_LSTR014181 [Laodelphax striatellus]|uniref:Uncharacterized protein n=1 Tax=Laodelphax striatellus TaxID=195883 RepID=A0A482XFQ8_LAOST|nr:hypothetical protein LSTR_LSTR014181 [Laodelphax striatellus]
MHGWRVQLKMSFRGRGGGGFRGGRGGRGGGGGFGRFQDQGPPEQTTWCEIGVNDVPFFKCSPSTSKTNRNRKDRRNIRNHSRLLRFGQVGDDVKAKSFKAKQKVSCLEG